jgi:hypothetical protein
LPIDRSVNKMTSLWVYSALRRCNATGVF